MTGELALVQSLIASIVVGYLLGSIPLAHLVARRRGIDIFATGSARAGTANVFWNISRRKGIMVFAGDATKGFLAIKFAILFGVPEQALILAGLAAVAGHWKSVFTRFRGGDGMVTLLGVTVALTPVLAILGIAVGITCVLLTRRYSFRSSFGVTACYIVMLVVSHTFGQFENHQLFVKELSVLALLVIFHNVLIHRIKAPALAEAGILAESDIDPDDFPDAVLDPDFPEKP